MRRACLLAPLLHFLAAVTCPGLAWEPVEPSSDATLIEPAELERLPATEEVEVGDESDATVEEEGGLWGYHSPESVASQSAWYGRIEYFGWKDFRGQYWLNKDEGAMATIGHRRRWDRNRTRLEFFGSQLQYDGLNSTVFGNHYVQGHVNYIGGRGEYDRFLFSGKKWNYFAGIGTRIWDREVLATDIDELWVSVYPYFGLETDRDFTKRIQFFYRARVGCTAFTYDRVSTSPATGFYPVPSFTTLVDFGFRGERLFLSGYLETFSWKESPVVHGIERPAAVNVLAGMQVGIYY